MFSSPYLDWTIERIALNAKVVGGPHGDKDKMVAAASESSIILWSIQDGGSGNEIGKFRTFRKCGLSRQTTTTKQKKSGGFKNVDYEEFSIIKGKEQNVWMWSQRLQPPAVSDSTSNLHPPLPDFYMFVKVPHHSLHPLPQVFSVSVYLLMISSSSGTSWWLQVTQERLECGMLSHSIGR